VLLDEIVAATRSAVAERKYRIPLDTLNGMIEARSAALDFGAAISGGGVKIIAEVKLASPSKGVLKTDLDPVAIARTYARGGAAAISVLTEEKYFQGSLENFKAIADDPDRIRLPLLRKDFIIDEYQVYEARANGADAVLLITAALEPKELVALHRLARSLGMAALVEVHDEEEATVALDCGARIIGINNRNLRTFKVDIGVTARLRPLVPKGRVVVSESGISSLNDIKYLQRLGVNAALIGEALITATDIGAKLRELRA